MTCKDCGSTKDLTTYEDGDTLCDTCLCSNAKKQVKESLDKRCPNRHWAFSFPEMAEKCKIDIKQICPKCQLKILDKNSKCETCDDNETS